MNKYITNIRRWEVPEGLGLESFLIAEEIPSMNTVTVDPKDYEELKGVKYNQNSVYVRK